MRIPEQQGQALAEAHVVLVVLASLWLAVAWIGRLQDIGLQLLHASRRAAFAHAHQDLDMGGLAAGADGYLAAAGHRWGARAGGLMLPADPVGDGTAPPGQPVEPAGPWMDRLSMRPMHQAGDPVAGAAAWRAQLRLGDEEIWRAVAVARTQGDADTTGRLRDFDRLSLRLRRHTAILRGTGAAHVDAEVQAMLGASPMAWRERAMPSITAGRHVAGRLQGIDAAWGRAHVSWDWLDPWTAWVPRDHLQPWSKP